MGYKLLAGSSITVMPGAASSAARASSTVNRTLEFNVDGFTVATKDGDADTGCGNLDIVITHDFLGFDNHLPLFLGGIVFQELIDMGNAVEGDLMSESIDSELFAVQELLSLRVQLCIALHLRPKQPGR